MRNILYLLTLMVLVSSCKTNKEAVFMGEFDERMLDTLVVSAPVTDLDEKIDYNLPAYNPSATRSYDLLHTRLDLSFDWENEHVLGQAELILTPLFYAIDTVVLDAKGFDIHSVAVNEMEATYTYDSLQISIALGRKYRKEDTLSLNIAYTAKPSESAQGGSDAITSDKGLFFINPRNETAEKPRQIWTQGETEHNSKWFPTFDKPNERCTQEMYLTVADTLQTLSNGVLVSSTNNGDGTKTDYWKMNQPHAPYLFMLAIGDFVRVKDKWRNVPLEYLVDPPYEQDAEEIFDHTPEMLEFFSILLDYPYPWDKYSQVIVHDYVSGAMENTTASIYGDFVQKNKKELIDNSNDKIVAHEMFHHWFGDLVTCESWSNLTLQEGFANYSEYLWLEHKEGHEMAEEHRMNEMMDYLFMISQVNTHPLIHYRYENKEDMFDVHSYNKGGLVLHMLRHQIGDKAFFTALNKYLNDYKYTAVEVDELRMVFEDVTGMDLNWFFDQWYLDKGHPIIEFQSRYDATSQSLTVAVEQVQDAMDHRPVFILPLELAVIEGEGKVSYHKMLLNHRKDSIVISNITQEPLAIVPDGRGRTLMELRHIYTDKEKNAMYKNMPQWSHKNYAITTMSEAARAEVAADLMQEDYYGFRLKGIEALGANADAQQLQNLTTEDKHSAVRATALVQLGKIDAERALAMSKRLLDNHEDTDYPTIKSALNVVYDNDKSLVYDYTKKLIAEDKSSTLMPILAEIIGETKDGQYLSYIEKAIDKVDIYQMFNVYDAYSNLLLAQDLETIYGRVDRLKKTSLIDVDMYSRYMSTNVLNKIKEKLAATQRLNPSEENARRLSKVKKDIKEIIAAEESMELLSRYRAYLNE